MSATWDGEEPPATFSPGILGWLRILVRGTAIVLIIACGLAILLPLRLIERPVHGMFRPWTPHITRIVCRLSLMCMGLTLERRGTPMRTPGALVANHSSWLDIFALNASGVVYFVSKSEVAGWPGIGFLARSTGTLFIARDRREARAQNRAFETRLLAGQRLLFFPEGTSTDGLRVLPFKSTLFEAFFAPDLRTALSIQPVSVTYHAPHGADQRTYGWWGDMDFAPHLLRTLALARQGRVVVAYHDPIRVADMPDRKALAAAAEAAVRTGHELA
ncbi:lysophospholipid acyltransferase family protein [Tateyamaria armeniaca]|uniref:Lysophospholipid acyltransferase family protein n=1 Tax=Tateyamaria armeniaca TaxID=2518930 RepID=A0ABW8UVR8_9RHOB